MNTAGPGKVGGGEMVIPFVMHHADPKCFACPSVILMGLLMVARESLYIFTLVKNKPVLE